MTKSFRKQSLDEHLRFLLVFGVFSGCKISFLDLNQVKRFLYFDNIRFLTDPV